MNCLRGLIIWWTVTLLVIGGCYLAFGNGELLQERQTLLEQRQKLTQEINRIDIRLIEIQGILKYIDKGE